MGVLKTFKQADSFKTFYRYKKSLEELKPKLKAHGQNHIGEHWLHVTWHEFSGWSEPQMRDEESIEDLGLFEAWSIFCWQPYPKQIDVQKLISPNATVAQDFLFSQEVPLTEDQKWTVRQLSKSWPSFYEVVGFEEGVGIEFKDLLNGQEVCVLEPWKSQSCRVGDLHFALTYEVPTGHHMIAGSNAILSKRAQNEVLEFRKSITPREKIHSGASLAGVPIETTTAVDIKNLKDYRSEIFELYDCLKFKANIHPTSLPPLPPQKSHDFHNHSDGHGDDHNKDTHSDWFN